ncbi:MAG: signal peptidase I [Deltaproteobacteria bacterium]|nr:signal peptidase I [Deltaproteobacteria bacterium]
MANTTDVLADDRLDNKSKSIVREYAEAFLWSFVLFLFIRTCVVQSFKIPSESMVNTLVIGDCLLVNKFIYGIKVPFMNLRLPKLRNPQRGDVVVFRFPLDRSNDFVKRLVGVPGDKIQIRDKQVYVNGTLYQNPHELHTDAQILPQGLAVRDNFGPIQVPANSYFMMGDNRDNSYDSRFWGFVPSDDIVGLAFIKYWSWDSNKWLPRLNRIGRLID